MSACWPSSDLRQNEFTIIQSRSTVYRRRSTIRRLMRKLKVKLPEAMHYWNFCRARLPNLTGGTACEGFLYATASTCSKKQPTPLDFLLQAGVLDKQIDTHLQLGIREGQESGSQSARYSTPGVVAMSVFVEESSKKSYHTLKDFFSWYKDGVFLPYKGNQKLL